MDKIKVPFVDLGRFYKKHREKILELTDQVGNSGIYILGNIVEEFERDFATYCGVNHAISVGNGTDALALCLHALDIGPGDEVIIPANSFIATAGAVVEVGAIPICVDVDTEQNISIDAIENAVTQKTKAIIVVHLNGNPARIKKIEKRFKNTNIKIIEDAAQSIGAEIDGKRTGSFGECGCFSLHPLKNFHMFGDGGMITTNSTEMKIKLDRLRNHGLIDRNKCEEFSRNSRLDALQASYGKYLLPYLEDWTERVIKIAEYYHSEFNEFCYVPKTREHVRSVYHNYVIQTQNRNELSLYLQEYGIETKIHYPIPIVEQPAWQKLSVKSEPVPFVKKQKEEILSLPIYAELNDIEVEYVAQKVKGFFLETQLVKEAV